MTVENSRQISSGDVSNVVNREAEEEQAKHHAKENFGEMRREAYSWQNRHIADELPREGELLDIGCGVGTLIPDLPRRYTYTGIDASENAVNTVRERFDVAASVADAHDLPFDDDRFDAVILRSVIHHFRDPEQVAAEAVRVVKPGGRIVVFEDAPEPLFRRIVSRLADVLSPGHEVSVFRHKSAAEIRQYFQEAGGVMVTQQRLGGLTFLLAAVNLLPRRFVGVTKQIDGRGYCHYYNLLSFGVLETDGGHAS